MAYAYKTLSDLFLVLPSAVAHSVNKLGSEVDTLKRSATMKLESAEYETTLPDSVIVASAHVPDSITHTMNQPRVEREINFDTPSASNLDFQILISRCLATPETRDSRVPFVSQTSLQSFSSQARVGWPNHPSLPRFVLLVQTLLTEIIQSEYRLSPPLQFTMLSLVPFVVHNSIGCWMNECGLKSLASANYVGEDGLRVGVFQHTRANIRHLLSREGASEMLDDTTIVTSDIDSTLFAQPVPEFDSTNDPIRMIAVLAAGQLFNFMRFLDRKVSLAEIRRATIRSFPPTQRLFFQDVNLSPSSVFAVLLAGYNILPSWIDSATFRLDRDQLVVDLPNHDLPHKYRGLSDVIAQGLFTATFPSLFGLTAKPVVARDSTLADVEFIPLGRISSGYGPRSDPFHKGHTKRHNGIDIAVPVGTPVKFPVAMISVSAGLSKSYGKYAEFRFPSDPDRRIFLAHLSKNDMIPGTLIQPNEIVAYTGNTGRSTGAHLHVEYRFYSKRQFIHRDPKELPFPVLYLCSKPA